MTHEEAMTEAAGYVRELLAAHDAVNTATTEDDAETARQRYNIAAAQVTLLVAVACHARQPYTPQVPR